MIFKVIEARDGRAVAESEDRRVKLTLEGPHGLNPGSIFATIVGLTRESLVPAAAESVPLSTQTHEVEPAAENSTAPGADQFRTEEGMFELPADLAEAGASADTAAMQAHGLSAAESQVDPVWPTAELVEPPLAEPTAEG